MAQGHGLRGWMQRWREPHSASAAAPLPELALPTGDGPLIWLRIGGDVASLPDGGLPPTLIQLLMQLRRRGLQIAVSRAAGGPPDLATRGISAVPDAALSVGQADAHISAMRPAAILLIGADLPRPLIEAALARDIPIVLAETRLSASERGWGLASLGLGRRSVLSQLTLLLLPDAASRDAAIDMGVSESRIEVTGPITQTREPLKHLEAERESLAEAFTGRQLWLAINVTEPEEQALIDAHMTVLRYSHRAILIALPDDPRRADAMASRMSDAGLIVAQRSLDEDPTDEVNVYLADDLFELGLWYRLAASCFMGSTLAGPTTTARDPFEAASLGSAAIHGPQDGPFSAEWAQLDGAGAARRVEDGSGLAQAAVALLAADQAAQIAANAWAVSTGGAGVANRIAHAIRDLATGDTA
ncbi:3-deoxy-D-manno-octulosonic acid transferase [Paracoccus aurantiacus]|uniref:3-deoxy-D-manno-octulosonic acid transferase n=1 Tax=Paracoccus aurantiacus TaxID=2599412 RepID=UPI00164BED32|nr:glycosyltransferase N-terminal domain-containing protein [Paracoccus aurantiacus]